MTNSYSSLIPLIKKKAIVTDPGEFHSRVNIIFHDYEAAHYDQLHRDMWESLPEQFELVANDAMPYFAGSQNLKSLDLGCGTGLATALLLDTAFGRSISEIHLVDTSNKMLEIAAKRAAAWGKKVQKIHGAIADVSDQYDVIVISSVLHHIPDLGEFLHRVSSLQKKDGILLTFHDPYAGSLQSETYKVRNTDYEQQLIPAPAQNLRLSKRIARRISQLIKAPPYLVRINRQLLKEKIIKEPLSEIELWSVTDIHVEGLPYSNGQGISKETMQLNLPDYRLASFRTYAFFGQLSSHLDNAYKQREHELSLAGDMNGRNFCSLWVKG